MKQHLPKSYFSALLTAQEPNVFLKQLLLYGTEEQKQLHR
jgi:hypothetical protein